MKLVSPRQLALQRWISRGALTGLALGGAAFGIAYFLSWRVGNSEPLAFTAGLLFALTIPPSLAYLALADAGAFAASGTRDFFVAFVILPLTQGVFVAILLWSLVRLVRRRPSARQPSNER